MRPISKRTFLGGMFAMAVAGCAAPHPRTMNTKLQQVALPDGRVLEVFLGGAANGFPLVFHHGTPGDATTFADWDALCESQGFRLICTSRAGYAGSTRLPGRAVAHVAKDTSALLDHLGHDRFATIGWSGGGPHALACAALLPSRCVAVATLAGVGPWGAQGLDFLAGMGPENVDEFGAALKGEAALREWMAQNGPPMQQVTGAQIIDALGGLVAEVDKAALRSGAADHLAAVMRRAVANGFDGWVDDDLAFTRPWGFDLDAIRQPASVWQGELDLMVPLAHGRWLQSHVPRALARVVPGEGHISLASGPRREQILALLKQQAAK